MHWSNFSKEQITEEERIEEMGNWTAHIKHLEEAHRVADLQLLELEHHPHVEESKVAELKKLKLKYKDEIEKLKQLHKDEA
jgi:hypothetical protein